MMSRSVRSASRKWALSARRTAKRTYVQAAYVIPDPKVRDREFGNLLAIPDNFPKKVVSMDAVTGGSYQGIEHVHLSDFLLSILN